jgi:hypothetical protein
LCGLLAAAWHSQSRSAVAWVKARKASSGGALTLRVKVKVKDSGMVLSYIWVREWRNGSPVPFSIYPKIFLLL